ncbi:MAG TPA: phage holin family protein, partial [Candidatus Limnocylindrales bacterium]|nr:phage holin family protein [Candidatus Limnocylindrales bacterium]
STPSSEAPAGIRAQIGATIEAGKRLVRAHVELAKAELGEIMGAVGRMVGLFAAAFVLVLFAATLLAIGGLLFLGEWLFGSIGWGVLLGVLLFLDIAVTAALLALDVSARRVGTSVGIAVVVGVVVGIVMAFDLTHRGWTAVGDSVAAAYDPNTRAVLLAVGVSAVVLGMLGFVTGIRSGFGHAWGRLIVWAIIGVFLGLLTVISLPGQVGAALGVLAALITWPILAGRDVARTGIDGEAMKQKFTPQQTIDLTKETIEWVRARTPLVPKS